MLKLMVWILQIGILVLVLWRLPMEADHRRLFQAIGAIALGALGGSAAEMLPGAPWLGIVLEAGCLVAAFGLFWRQRRTKAIVPLAMLILAATGTPLRAQQGELPRPDDVATLDGIMKAYYEVVSGPAGSLPDPARDQSLHHPNAQITLLNRKADGTAAVDVTDLAGYYRQSGTGPRKRGFFEREISRVTQRIGALVHVWSTYEASETPGGKAQTRGINSIQLYWDGSRWWILGWVFDDERNGGKVPVEYLPQR